MFITRLNRTPERAWLQGTSVLIRFTIISRTLIHFQNEVASFLSSSVFNSHFYRIWTACAHFRKLSTFVVPVRPRNLSSLAIVANGRECTQTNLHEEKARPKARARDGSATAPCPAEASISRFAACKYFIRPRLALAAVIFKGVQYVENR